MSAGKTIKRLHRKAQKGNLFRSLKEFARELASSDPSASKLVDEWYENKAGALQRADQAARMERKGATLAEIKSKVHAARRKGSSGGGKK